MLLIDGSKSVSNGGRTATGDQSYYRDYVFKMIKEMINDFGVGENENIHMGAIFFGKENIADTVSEVRFVLHSITFLFFDIFRKVIYFRGPRTRKISSSHSFEIFLAMFRFQNVIMCFLL